jgi:two-component system KDP operon response regulator KdpE
VYITSLRKKIEATPQVPELIVTEPGVGYRLKLLPPA